MNNLLSILLAKPASGPNPMSSIIMFGLILVVFYFFMIAPQRRKMKEAKKFSEGLEKGQRIITIGGIHGKIEEVRDTTLIISVEGGTKLKIEKSAISSDRTLLLNSPENQAKLN
jgi:preprotein translocase subunit YajC